MMVNPFRGLRIIQEEWKPKPRFWSFCAPSSARCIVIFRSIPFQICYRVRKIAPAAPSPFTRPNLRFNGFLAPFAGLLCPHTPGPITIEERTCGLSPFTVRAGLTDAKERSARNISIRPRVPPGIATEC
jgi:hypothetical protein